MTIKSNSIIITITFLKQHYVSKKVINFFERNFPETLFPNGLDLSKVEITGDYEGYVYTGYFQRIKNLLACKHEYNSEGNMIKRIFPNGYTEEYNDEGNIVKKVYLNGYTEEYIYSYKYNNNFIEEYIYTCKYECKFKKKKYSKKCYFGGIDIDKYQYEYDHNGRLIKKIWPNGYTEEYNSKGDLIKKVNPKCKLFPNGKILTYQYLYDDRGNKIQKKFESDDTFDYPFKYDSIGRLIQADSCHIKYLDDNVKNINDTTLSDCKNDLNRIIEELKKFNS